MSSTPASRSRPGTIECGASHTEAIGETKRNLSTLGFIDSDASFPAKLARALRYVLRKASLKRRMLPNPAACAISVMGKGVSSSSRLAK